MGDATTYRLDRGFRLIGPFFAALLPLTVWAFFIDESEPPNNTGGVVAIGVLSFFAVFSHLTWVRTRVVITGSGIWVRGVVGERHAAWPDVIYARIDGSDLAFHVVNGKPLKASVYLANFGDLIELAQTRRLLRSDEQVG